MVLKEYKRSGISFIKVINYDNLEIILSDLGASIYQINFHKKIMTLTPKFLIDFKNPSFVCGKSIGRVASSIFNAEVTIDGTLYRLEKNSGENTQHGGTHSFSNAIWNYKINDKVEYIDVIFTRISEDGEAGFPGNLKVKVTYRIYSYENKFEILLDAKSDKNTVFNFTNHTNFCLGDKNLDNMYLEFKAKSYNLNHPRYNYQYKIEKLPKNFDFFSSRLIDTRIDNYFSFNDKNYVTIHNKNFKLTIKTSYPGAIIWTQNNYKKLLYKNFNDYDKGSIAIEPCNNMIQSLYLEKNKSVKESISYTFEDIGK